MEAWKRTRGIEGVVLDAALFYDTGAIAHVEKLLYRLCYSNRRLGILFLNADDNEFCILQNEKLEKCMPPGHSFDSKKASNDNLSDVLNSLSMSWELSAPQCIFVTPFLQVSLKSKLIGQGWHICLLSESTHLTELSFDKTINQIQEFYCQMIHKNKEAGEQVVVVGYSMKWTREIDFLKRGALPLHVTDNNLIFFPINLDLPLPQQFETLDVMLHKPTDEITSVSLGKLDCLHNQIRFTDAMQQAIGYLSSHPQICVVDPIEKISPLLDRALTQKILQGLSNLENFSGRIRAPRYKTVLKFDKINPLEVLKDCSFSLPVIVKPQTACGITDAHIMAVVFKEEGFLNLAVPVPSMVQVCSYPFVFLHTQYICFSFLTEQAHQYNLMCALKAILWAKNSTLLVLEAFFMFRMLTMKVVECLRRSLWCQEYIDHRSMLYKFYVIGESVFYSIRKSTPNAAKLTESSLTSNIPAAVTFDSLKSLPKHFMKDEQAPSGHSLPSTEIDGLDFALVCTAATWLREELKLTIFGFDVVIQMHTNDHVIIDVNFFPTFKDIDERRAIPAFWDALSRAYTLHKQSQAAQS